jgi:hypothetical protein
MARIRTIKPEFPQSETIGRLSRDARLLFVQLWTIADDCGRLRGASRMLASLLYPYDNDAPKLIGAWLDELEKKECIRRYEVEGSQYIEIINWLKHQKIDRPSTSRIPAFVEGSTPPREESRGSDADLGPRTVDQGPRIKDRVAAVAAARDDEFEKFWKTYPRTPVMAKKETLREWGKLSIEDQKAAFNAVDPYKDWLKKQKDHPVVHACRFLSQRRFDGFAAQGDSRVMVTLPPLSAEWQEARRAKITRGESVSFMDAQAAKGIGWTAPSEPVIEAPAENFG